MWIDRWQVEKGGLIARSWHEPWRTWAQPLGAMPGWEGAAPYARPTVVAVFSIIHALVGPQPWAFHLCVVLVHVCNVLLVYGLLRRLAVQPVPAGLAGALFAVHPVQTAAVTWISGIADPLFTLFVLAALHLHWAARTRGGCVRRALAAVSFACALGAKETAVTLPFLLLAAELLVPSPGLSINAKTALRRAQGERKNPLKSDHQPLVLSLSKHVFREDRQPPPPDAWPQGRRGRGIAVRLAPFLIVLAAAVAYRVSVLGSGALGNPFGAIPLSTRLLTAPRLVLSYLTLPLRVGALTVCDDYLLSPQWDATAVASIGGVAAVVAGIIVSARRFPHVAFGLTWALLALAPVLNVVPILHYRADRFLYFPMIGWSLAAVTLLQHGVQWLQERVTSPRTVRRAARIITVCVVALLAALTMQRNRLFADDVTLFEATVRVSPLCREARTTLGDAYLRAGRSGEAVEQYERALAPQPRRAGYVVLPKVLINLGMAHVGRNDYRAALQAFSRAQDLQPGLLHPLFGLGIANLGLGDVAAGVTWLERAHAVDAADPDVTFNLALGYDRLGKTTEAVAMYQHYLDVAPRGRARGMAQERLRALTPPEG